MKTHRQALAGAGAGRAALIDRGRLLRPASAAPLLAAIDAQVEGMQVRAACGTAS